MGYGGEEWQVEALHADDACSHGEMALTMINDVVDLRHKRRPKRCSIG